VNAGDCVKSIRMKTSATIVASSVNPHVHASASDSITRQRRSSRKWRSIRKSLPDAMSSTSRSIWLLMPWLRRTARRQYHALITPIGSSTVSAMNPASRS
jgi:hypothetical protein